MSDLIWFEKYRNILL